MNGGLIGQLTAHERRSVGLRDNGKVGEDGRPAWGELTLNADPDPVANRSVHRGPP